MAKKLTTKKATKPKAAKAKTAPARAKSTSMTLEDTLRQLKSLGKAGVRAQNAKSGAGDNQFGVSRGDLRILANKIKTNHELALSLWKTGNIDAQFLATLLIKVNLLSADEMDRMVRSRSPLRGWPNGSTPMSSRSTPTKRPFARNGWSRMTAGRPAPDGN